jgi:hypothetical protein
VVKSQALRIPHMRIVKRDTPRRPQALK